MSERTQNPKSQILNHKSLFARRLLAWFRHNARDLPWRRTRDPYCIWVSEIMLQQTQVATVIGYYERFLARFPTVRALADASEEDVLRVWEGLGYYRRARQMHLAARQMAAEHGGTFPRRMAEVRALPGIGRYTAGAILSIAHDDREPILEANTIRLLCRLSAYRADPARSAGQKHLWSLAESVLPQRRAGQFNQALMELGSQLCTPRAPNCDKCPVSRFCRTHELGLHDEVPLAPRKARYEDVREAALIIRRGGRVLVRRCGPKERWAGLWDFPRFVVTNSRGAALRRELAEKTRKLTNVVVEPGAQLAIIKHGVTRFRITLLCHEARFVSSPKRFRLDNNLRWVLPESLADLPLSVTGRKICQLITA